MNTCFCQQQRVYQLCTKHYLQIFVIFATTIHLTVKDGIILPIFSTTTIFECKIDLFCLFSQNRRPFNLHGKLIGYYYRVLNQLDIMRVVISVYCTDNLTNNLIFLFLSIFCSCFISSENFWKIISTTFFMSIIFGIALHRDRYEEHKHHSFASFQRQHNL